MAETLFEELKRYVAFGPDDEATLVAFHPLARPHFERIADVFYDRILRHEGARKALLGGESQVGRLKVTLKAWLEKLLLGPYDEDYYELRARIGRAHVRIALPQHYMFGAMNVVRSELQAVVDCELARDAERRRRTTSAVGKILDLELAIMLHTYREDLLSAQARVERLSTFGQLVGSIGHELRNPLSVIETSLFILRSRVGQDERAFKHAERIGEQVRIANDIVSKLLDMIRDRPLAREAVRLVEVVRDAAAAVARPEGVSLSIDGLEALPSIDGDAVQLRQVVVNLLENAVHAASPRGAVRIAGKRDGEAIWLEVEDTGPGVDPAIRPRLFEPLVTTKPKGIGLGLALVKRIVERHGGTISYSPREPNGTRFVLRLPIRNG